ncbi:MAG: tRNA (guanosine(37)-N1)-methyltransferase TrmD [Candidatus Metalachnospira sp.]|nr:tRNA (guanosine(37)-N1)-methyltransferase TrmD [Candidatus Metalachnospira sp.]
MSALDFYVLTLFPEMINQTLSYSVIGRAIKEEIIRIDAVDIRDFSKDKHRHVDDYPYGGGAGMVMQPQPVYDAYKSVKDRAGDMRVVYLTPQGRKFDQGMAEEFAKEKNIMLLCGHYEGVDERVIEDIVTDEVSIGDFVLTGGEIAAVAIIDAVSRLIPGVLNKEESFENESFSDGLLEYPQYTRPPVFMDKPVPDILLSGHHANIDRWRREKSIERTYNKRSDLLKGAKLSEKDIKFLNKLKNMSDNE